MSSVTDNRADVYDWEKNMSYCVGTHDRKRRFLKDISIIERRAYVDSSIDVYYYLLLNPTEQTV